VAHSPADWLDLAGKMELFSAYRAFVICLTDDDIVYSCGMHHLGLPEAIVDASASDDPERLIMAFTFYLFTESPVIQAGQTFQMEPGAPVYRLHEDEGVRFEPKDLHHNPYGTWRLRPC
jgi:hypothetical protein